VEPRPPSPARARLLDEERHALGVAQARHRRTYGPGSVAITLLLVLACGLAVAIPLMLVSRGVVEESSLEWLVPTSLLGTFALGTLLAVLWQASTPVVTREAGVPGPTSAAAVARELRRLRLARLAEERSLATHVRPATRSLDLILGASLLLPAAAGATWFTVEMVRGTEPYEPALAWLWLAIAAGLAVLVGLRLRRHRLRRELQAALERACRPFEARSLPRHDDVVEWLGGVWAAASAHEDLYEGTGHVAIAGRLRGYPVLIDVEPEGYADGEVEIPPRVLVHVAALVGSEPPAWWHEQQAALDAAGLAITLVPQAGLLARARPEWCARMRREPARLLELGGVVERMVALAEASGAAPAPHATELQGPD
jgi:hypothetical protein